MSNTTATNAGQALKELLETEASALKNHGPALSHGAHTHDLRGRSLNRSAALDLKMLGAAHEAHAARWSHEAADAQTHAPWCGRGTPSECEATRLALRDDEGECWDHANDDGSADRAAEKWANAWG